MIAALVDSRVWSDDDALDEASALPVQRHIDTLSALVGVVGEVAFERLCVDADALSLWSAPASHVGVWVAGLVGSDRLLVQIARRRLARGQLSHTLVLAGRIGHLRMRTEVLLAIHPQLEESQWEIARRGAVEAARAIVHPVARYHALAWVAPLFEREQAIELVWEAISSLPPRERAEWCHVPGGLMLMPLAGEVANAMLAAGLDDELVVLAAQLGEPFASGLHEVDRPLPPPLRIDTAVDRREIDAALAHGREGKVYELWQLQEVLDGPAREEALDLARRVASSASPTAEALLLYWALSRGVEPSETDAARKLTECAAAIPWERWPQLSIWSSEAWKAALEDRTRAAVARAALSRIRSGLAPGDDAA